MTKHPLPAQIFLCLTLCLSCRPNPQGQNTREHEEDERSDFVYVPEIEGEWWQVALNPDLGTCTGEKQEPVDFGIWQAGDGTWQLWSCIRHTSCGQHTRLFYGWEGGKLTDSLWTPLGIVMEADTAFGELSGGLQAPHVIKKDDIYYMLYGGWNNICLASSEDGKVFHRVLNEQGRSTLFRGPMENTRDAMTLLIDGLYHCYYTGHLIRDTPGYDSSAIKAAIFCRTSEDLIHWSTPGMVSGGGRVAEMDSWGGGDAECPFVVQIEDKFVLFRNQLYGPDNLNTQYCSGDPFNFGIDDDRFEVGQLPVAAPEIIQVGEQYYIAALEPDLDGIRIARLKFVKKYPGTS